MAKVTMSPFWKVAARAIGTRLSSAVVAMPGSELLRCLWAIADHASRSRVPVP